MQEEKTDQETSANEAGNLSPEKINEESVNKPSDETLREVLRGDESKGDADKRDVVGSVDSIDTPQGREEAKKDEGSDS